MKVSQTKLIPTFGLTLTFSLLLHGGCISERHNYPLIQRNIELQHNNHYKMRVCRDFVMYEDNPVYDFRCYNAIFNNGDIDFQMWGDSVSIWFTHDSVYGWFGGIKDSLFVRPLNRRKDIYWHELYQYYIKPKKLFSKQYSGKLINVHEDSANTRYEFRKKLPLIYPEIAMGSKDTWIWINKSTGLLDSFWIAEDLFGDSLFTHEMVTFELLVGTEAEIEIPEIPNLPRAFRSYRWSANI